jgi:hypothetical protein
VVGRWHLCSHNWEADRDIKGSADYEARHTVRRNRHQPALQQTRSNVIPDSSRTCRLRRNVINLNLSPNSCQAIGTATLSPDHWWPNLPKFCHLGAFQWYSTSLTPRVAVPLWEPRWVTSNSGQLQYSQSISNLHLRTRNTLSTICLIWVMWSILWSQEIRWWFHGPKSYPQITRVSILIHIWVDCFLHNDHHFIQSALKV